MSIRVFYDGRKKKITDALKEIGGIKVKYGNQKKENMPGYCTYRDLDQYDFIIEEHTFVMARRASIERNIDLLWNSWSDRYITEQEFFDKVNQIKNLEFIKTL